MAPVTVVAPAVGGEEGCYCVALLSTSFHRDLSPHLLLLLLLLIRSDCALRLCAKVNTGRAYLSGTVGLHETCE